MADSLFADRARRDLVQRQPLAARLRPRTLDGIVGQDHLLGPGAPLRLLIEADRVSSLVLWGPAGTGKTTIAEVIAASTAKAFVARSAVSATVKDVRAELAAAEQRLGEQGQGTILFLDEVHRFNKAQQDALLPAVESGLIVLVGATTENPYFEVNPPLLSRSALFRLHRLDDDALGVLLQRGLEETGASADPDALQHLAARAGGDGRATLGALEVAVALAGQRGEPAEVRLADAEAAVDAAAMGYGIDDHYDVASAFIKSIRGSDPDAGLYWLARMLEAGEDPRFVARRLVILASEDVGMADPQGVLVADAAARAVEYVGLPEAALNLAHAVVYLATAPKSNRVTVALSRARAEVRSRRGEVPPHLRDAHYAGAQGLGHGEGYEYPHDDPRGWCPQQHRPHEAAGSVYYEPSPHGVEQQIYDRWLRTRHQPLPGEEPDEPVS
ncbi:MAG: replication-associated recombination protein A [Acidimicrobiia bacterium]|nr:replication-associated recombination protein A [Acidimicrobiia bacterium]